MAQSSTADDLNQLTKNIQETLRSLGVPKSQESKNNERYLAGAIQAFSEALASEDEEAKNILKRWKNYLISVSHFSNTNYTNAINKQLADYYKAIADTNNTLQENKAKRKSEYSSSWVGDLVNHFGIEFIKKNKTAIKYCLMAISFPDESFERKFKDLMYIEAMLFGSYKRYFGLFLTFYKEELDQNEQNKIEPHKKIAENYLALIDNVSFASMHNTTVLQNILTENKARRLNDEVFRFLKAHPLLHTFRNTKALDDLRKVTEE
jgi:uncharacterized protein YukE